MNQLKINIDLLKNEGKIENSIASYHTDALKDLVEGYTLSVRYEATDLGNEYLLRGVITGSFRLNCGKCLNDFDLPVTGIEFAQSFEAGTHEIDVEEEIRQALLLNVPLHPVCSQQCKGLCPSCGINRNETACDCHRDQSNDPRWDKLRKLL